MTLKIEVEVPTDMVLNDRAGAYLAKAMSAIGYRRESAAPAPAESVSHIAMMPDAPVKEDEYVPSVLNEPSVQQAVAKRERGKPSPGKARRTKEEIAEDDAADLAEAKARAEYHAAADHGEAQAMTAAQAEEHTNPVVSGPVDSPEVEAQDAADEQAEVEANRNPEQPLTHEDLRNAMGAYVNAYGLAVTQADGPTIFLDALGAPPAGEEKWKLSLVPEGKIGAAIEAWKKAVAENPFDRAKVA